MTCLADTEMEVMVKKEKATVATYMFRMSNLLIICKVTQRAQKEDIYSKQE